MSSWKWFLVSFLGGAAAFWAPDMLLKALYLGPNTPTTDAALTVACPAAAVLFFAFVRRRRIPELGGPSTALFALVGFWLFALLFIMLARTFQGGGFRDAPFEWRLIGFFVTSSLIPTRTFFFSMLDGSAGGLILGTAAMIICYFRFERRRWIIPPAVTRWE